MNHAGRNGPEGQTAPADPWFDWLTSRRHGGDPGFELSVRRTVESYRNRVLDGAQLAEGMTLLDVGAGDGLIAFGAIARVGPSLKVILADISPALLQRAEAVACQLGFQDSCVFLQGSAERLEKVPDASADVVTTRAVLAYVQDKAAAAREFRRVLKPGGRISLAEPIYRDESLHLARLAEFVGRRPADPSTLDARLFLRWKGAQLPSTPADIRASPLTNFTERDLITFFEDAGFVDTHLELHIDMRKAVAVPWDAFLDTAHHPQVPTVREILATRFTEEERRHFADKLRPVVEAGQILNRDTIAYLTAVKPK